MTTTSESDSNSGAFVPDPTGRDAPFPGETLQEAWARWAVEDEVDEDPALSERTKWELRELQEERRTVAELSSRSLSTDMPRAVRELFRQQAWNPQVRQLYDKVVQELFERADDKMRSALLPAVDKMVGLMDSDDDKVALRAATYVFERLRGKTPDVVQVTQDKPFQVILERVVAGPRIAAERLTPLEASQEPIDAEIVPEGPHSAEDDPYEEERQFAARWSPETHKQHGGQIQD